MQVSFVAPQDAKRCHHYKAYENHYKPYEIHCQDEL